MTLVKFSQLIDFKIFWSISVSFGPHLVNFKQVIQDKDARIFWPQEGGRNNTQPTHFQFITWSVLWLTCVLRFCMPIDGGPMKDNTKICWVSNARVDFVAICVLYIVRRQAGFSSYMCARRNPKSPWLRSTLFLHFMNEAKILTEGISSIFWRQNPLRFRTSKVPMP